MTLRTILPYYHPTTVVMLDDNQRFLESFSLQLEEDSATLLFTSPQKCLATINSRIQMMPLDRRCLSWYREKDSYARDIVRFDLALIEQEISNPERFADISVVIVDYAMPGMDGLEFCRQIENPRIKKVLLTGVADESIAVDAFNEGLIDRFLMKSDASVTDRINIILDDLKHQYFSEVSAGIQSTMTLQSPDFLHDQAFKSYFASLREKSGIVEYYYVEDPQGILMLDCAGNLTRLAVFSESQVQGMLFELRSLGVDKATLTAVQNGRLLPCFWGEAEDLLEEDADINDFLYPGFTINGSQPWHCALVDNPPADIEYDPKRASYNSFLQKLASHRF